MGEKTVQTKQPQSLAELLANLQEQTELQDLTLQDLPEVLDTYKSFRVGNRASVRNTEKSLPIALRVQHALKELNERGTFLHQTGLIPTRDRIVTLYRAILEDWTSIAIRWLLDLGPEVLLEVSKKEDLQKLHEVLNKFD